MQLPLLSLAKILPGTLTILLFLIACLQSADALQDEVPIKQSVSRGIRDVATLENGETTYLFWHAATLKDEPPARVYSNIYKTFIRLFDHPSDPNAKLGIAWLDSDRKNGLGLYSFKDEKTTFVVHIGERMRQPSFFQSHRGDIFVGSRNGVIYWIKPDFTLSRYQLERPAGQEPDPRKMFRAIQFTSHPDSDLVCMYSIADPRYHKLALYDILMADPETGWRTIELGKRLTGPAVMSTPQTLKMLIYDRWLNVDLKNASVTEQVFPIPREGDSKVKPLLVTRLSDGTLMSIWRKLYRSYVKGDVDAYADGKYQQILQWDNDQWKIVGGKDQAIQKKIVQVTDNIGGWWLGTAEGTLLYRSPNGDLKHFDYRTGIAVDSISRLKVEGNNRLWIFGATPMAANIRLLTKQKPHDDGKWLQVYSRISLGESWYAPFRPVAPAWTPENTIHCFGGKDRTYRFPDKTLVPVDGKNVILYEDNQNRPWVISTGDDAKWIVAGFVNDDWQLFDVQKLPNLNWYESVAQWFSEQGLVRSFDFLGTRVAFGPEGRIAYCRSRISIFDGKKWHQNGMNRELENLGSRPQSVEFTPNGLRMWMSRYLAADLAYHHFGDLDSGGFRPWIVKRSPLGVSSNYRQRLDKDKERLASSPLHKLPGSWHFNDQFRTVQFTHDKFALFDGQRWTKVAAKFSPFSARRAISGLYRDTNGRWVFRTPGVSPFRYQVFRPESPVLSVIEADLGELSNADDSFRPQWKSSIKLNDVHIRFRVDDGDWSEWQPGEIPVVTGPVAPEGIHHLYVQLHCSDVMLPVHALRYNFNVGMNMAGKVDEWVEKLGAMDFQSRQEAETNILKYGKSFQSLLAERFESETDPETKSTIGKILRKLGGEDDK